MKEWILKKLMTNRLKAEIVSDWLETQLRLEIANPGSVIHILELENGPVQFEIKFNLSKKEDDKDTSTI